MFHTPRLIAQAGGTRSSATLMLGLILSLSSLSLSSVSAEELKLLRQSAPHMGTQWHLALYSPDPESANRAFDAAWAVIREIDQQLTNYDNDSELMRLCRSAPHETPVVVGDHLWQVLDQAHQLSTKTNGAFDVTVGPLTKLWRRARRRQELPATSRLNQARQLVGYTLLEFEPARQAVGLPKQGMLVDLGGIAKGYAVDRALEAIGEAGCRSALVNGGGDLAVSSAPPGEQGWLVRLAHLNPQDRSEQAEIQLANAAIATSGDGWQSVMIDGKRYSHIVDPRTGMGLTSRTASSIVAPNCMQADAWASAVCVLGADAGFKLVDEEAEIRARIITLRNDGQITLRQSRDFPPFLQDSR